MTAAQQSFLNRGLKEEARIRVAEVGKHVVRSTSMTAGNEVGSRLTLVSRCC